MEYLLVGVLVLIGVLVFVFQDKSESKSRTSYEKKSELIQSYEDELKQIINDNQHNKELLTTKKVQFLKNASHELHNNIFFDEAEAKQIIKKLASL